MCIFCKIVKKEIPSYCVYEDDIVMAFLDISQVTKGHTLIVPKQHFNNMLTCDDAILAHVMHVAKLVGNHLMKKLHAEGMNILSNVHEVAGQTVEHFHMHIIPRYDVSDACVIRFDASEEQDLHSLSDILHID